jgi:hypothetical protein
MRKLVVALVVTLALFTFIRELPSTRNTKAPMKAEIRSAIIP